MIFFLFSNISKFIKILCIILIILISKISVAQVTPLLLTIENQHYVNDSTFRYAVYLKNTGTTNFSLEGLGISVKVNTGWRNNGVMNQTSIVNGVFTSPHTLIETGLQNATTFQGTISSLAVAGEHFPYKYGATEFAFFQKSSTLSKSNGLLVAPNSRLYIGLFELKNTVPFNKTIGAGIRFNFNPIQGTQIYEDSAVLGKDLYFTYYQIENAIVASDAPDTIMVTSSIDSAIIIFPLVNKANGYFTGNYDSSAAIFQYIVRVYNASNNLFGMYAGTSSPLIIKGLPTGSYRFSVAALNAADTSAESVRSTTQNITKGIDVSASAINGFITPSNIQVTSGGMARFSYRGVFGYALDSIFVNGVYDAVASNDSLSTFSLYNITTNTNIVVKFSLVQPNYFTSDTLTVCQGTTIGNLENTYSNSVWYSSFTSISPFLSNYQIRPGYYFASSLVKGVESQIRDSIYIRFYNINVPNINDTSFCSNQISAAQLFNLNSNVIWYNSPSNNLDTLNPSSNLSTKYYYYRVKQFGCLSYPDSVFVTILPTVVDLNLPDTSFCANDGAQVLNLIHTKGNATINWYQDTKSQQKLYDTMHLMSGRYYYQPSIASNRCIAGYDSINVTINLNPIAPILDDTTLCNSGNTISTISNLFNNNDNSIIWYDTNLNETAPLLSTVPLVSKDYFYSLIDNNGCQSNFNSIFVNVLYRPLKPIINSVFEGNGQLTVEINRAQDINVQFYQLFGSPGGIFQISNSPEITVPNLTNNTTYSFKVIAINCAGVSDTSDVVMGTPLPDLYNINTSVTNGLGGYISPSTSVRRGFNIRITYTALPKYILDSVFVNGRFVQDSTLGYTFYNVNGDSSIVVSYRSYIVPNPPVITNVIAGYGTASLYFTHINGTGPLTSFYAVYTSNNVFVTQATSSPIKITGLNPNVSYQFKMYAFNQVGSSIASNLSNPITPNIKTTATITTIAGLNGSISPSLTIPIGTTIRITYQGKTNYVVDSVWVNNTYIKDSLTGYTFNNIGGDSTIYVSFKLIKPILPIDNFNIIVSNPTCIGMSNGGVMLTIDTALDYKLRFVGNGIDTVMVIRTMFSLTNLAKGNYSLFITINNFDTTYFYKRFDVTLSEPQSISSYSIVNSNDKIAELHLQGGGTTYYITINGQFFQTQSNTIKLPLEIGVNTIVIKTNKQCIDSVIEKIVVSDHIILYPNPAQNAIHLNFGGNDDVVDIEIYDDKGNLNLRESKTIQSDKNVTINISNLANGIYFVKIKGKTLDGTLKFLKQ